MAKQKDTSSDYPIGLKEALYELPHIETVYIKGNEWHFIKRTGFKPVDREDIINSGTE